MIDVNKNGGDTKESYIGKLKHVFDDYIVIDYDIFIGSNKIKSILINKNHIVSIWVYDEKSLNNIKRK